MFHKACYPLSLFPNMYPKDNVIIGKTRFHISDVMVLFVAKACIMSTKQMKSNTIHISNAICITAFFVLDPKKRPNIPASLSFAIASLFPFNTIFFCSSFNLSKLSFDTPFMLHDRQVVEFISLSGIAISPPILPLEMYILSFASHHLCMPKNGGLTLFRIQLQPE